MGSNLRIIIIRKTGDLRKLFSIGFCLWVLWPSILIGKAHPLMSFVKDGYDNEAGYVMPSQQTQTTAEDLFYRLFTKPISELDPQEWDQIGFSVLDTENYIVIREKENDHTGKGTYLIRKVKNVPQIVLIPHYPSDIHTATLGAQLLEEGPFLAAGFSSVHRKQGNLTRETNSIYNAFTRAFARSFPHGNIVQLHGWEDQKHGAAVDLIMSSTLKQPPQGFMGYNQCLKKLPFRVAAYPLEFDILGGEKNTNAKAFYETSMSGLFFHLEMNRPMRKDLIHNKGLRTQFEKCFEVKDL